MKNFDVLTRDTISKKIKETNHVTFHEVDCYADLSMDGLKRCVINNDELSVVDNEDNWFTLNVQSILEITFMDELTVILYDQNLLM